MRGVYHNMVFDLGGVVFNYNPKEYLVERFYNERTEKKLYDAVFGSEEWQLMDLGKLTWNDASAIFMQRGKAKDVAFEMRALLEEWTELLTTRSATVVLMRLLKKNGFNIYYLSNLSKEVHELIARRDFWPLFDGGVLSYEVGVAKPDLEIYQILLKKYKLAPQETIFTDDTKANSSAAFETGITGIQFRNVKSFCKMLVTYGIEI